MPAYDFRTPRLYVDAPLHEAATVALDRSQAHYLTAVMRLKSGAGVLVFNGRDGEWQAAIRAEKRAAVLQIGTQTRPQIRAR